MKSLFYTLILLSIVTTGCSPHIFKPGTTLEIESETLKIASFNVQFLGNSSNRDNEAITSILEPYDIVVVQELLAPPYHGTFPDGSAYRPDTEAKKFFEEMRELGFRYALSAEDTGPGPSKHNNGFATEWWVTFFRPERVKIARDLPNGFLAQNRYEHADFERVPHAFGFRTIDRNLDFVLVSVHLKPGANRNSRRRRAHELSAIKDWIARKSATEKDFVILGDMNIENENELNSATPEGFVSLNGSCAPTNTLVSDRKPYDHVMVNQSMATAVDQDYDFSVVDLIDEMAEKWNLPEAFPGTPYNHNKFRSFYSDHHPVDFRIKIPAADHD